MVRHWADFGIILALLVVNALVGFWEEYQADTTIAALKAQLALQARVKRDGAWVTVAARELVPGDRIHLRLGEIVPADARLLEGDPVEVDQSALTGYALVALARTVGSSGKVCGIDLSEGMCRVAQARAQKAHMAERVKLTCGDAVRLPYAARSFDAVYMSFTLELFDTPEIPTVLRECARVLRDGGRLGVIAMSKRGRVTLMTRLYAWAHQRFPRYVDCRPIPVRQVIEEAGFQVETVTALSMWGLPVEVVVARKGA